MSLLKGAFQKARKNWRYRFIAKSGDITAFINMTLKEKDFLRKDLAEALGRTPQQVTNMLKEENNYTIKTLAQISSALDVDLDEMFTFKPERKANSVLGAQINLFFDNESFEVDNTNYPALQNDEIRNYENINGFSAAA